MSNLLCNSSAVKTEFRQEQHEVQGEPNSTPQRRVSHQRCDAPIPRKLPTVHFESIPIGGRFEYRGHRYRKLALSMASDEDRNGNVFMAHVEVLPDNR